MMILNVAPDVRLRGEIWTSLVTMLRSYAALHADIDVKIRTIGGLDIALLESKHADMEVDFRAASGAGMWHLKRAAVKESGAFEVQRDGTLYVDGKPIEIDMAAMDLVERLFCYEHNEEGEPAE